MLDPPFPVYSFDFRVVTPLFLGGVEPDVEAELRPPTIKGALREWYRNLVGPGVAARTEAGLFGGAGDGGGQSPFRLAIDAPCLGTEPWSPPRAGPDRISGLGYLGYSLNLGANRRKAIGADRGFRLEAALPRSRADAPAGEAERALLASLWLLAHLGGLGTRSRRGFGSLALKAWERTPADDAELRRLPLLVDATDAADVAQRLGNGIAALRRWFPAEAGLSPDPSRSLGSRLDDARIQVVRGPNRGGGWDRASDALEHVGAAMQLFRRQPIDDFPTTRLLSRGERLPGAPARTAFGLPLAYRTRDGKTYSFAPHLPGTAEDARSGAGKRGGVDYGRFPSSLLIHVQATTAGYFPVLTLLAGPRPGRDVAVRERRGRGHLEPDAENDVVERFLEEMSTAGALGVRP